MGFNSGLKGLKTNRRLLYLKAQFVPRCKHFSSIGSIFTFRFYFLSSASISFINVYMVLFLSDNVIYVFLLL